MKIRRVPRCKWCGCAIVVNGITGHKQGYCSWECQILAEDDAVTEAKKEPEE
jgi:hypothetical protein